MTAPITGKPELRRRLDFVAAGWLGAGFVSLLGRTWRISVEPADAGERIERGEVRGLMAFWHGNLLTVLYGARGLPFAVPVSEHKDGEYVAQVMSRLGLLPIRGSSTRGGVKVIRRMREAAGAGWLPAITPDGPRGPRHSVQAGIVHLAAATELPILPVGIAASAKWSLPSWDRFEIPKPWAAVAIVIGQALSVPARPDRGDLPALCEEVRSRIEEATKRAEALAARKGG